MFLYHCTVWEIHPTNMSEHKTGNWISECLTTVSCILKYISFLWAKPIPLNTLSHIQLCTILPDVRYFCGARQYPYICKKLDPQLTKRSIPYHPADNPEMVAQFITLSRCTPFSRNASHPLLTSQSGSVSNVSFMIHTYFSNWILVSVSSHQGSCVPCHLPACSSACRQL